MITDVYLVFVTICVWLPSTIFITKKFESFEIRPFCIPRTDFRIIDFVCTILLPFKMSVDVLVIGSRIDRHLMVLRTRCRYYGYFNNSIYKIGTS